MTCAVPQVMLCLVNLMKHRVMCSRVFHLRHWSCLGKHILCHLIDLGLSMTSLLRPGRCAEYCDQPICLCVCLSTNISLEPLDRSAQTFVCRSPVAVAGSSSGGVALCYVLPVLWMKSYLTVMGHITLHGWLERLLFVIIIIIKFL